MFFADPPNDEDLEIKPEETEEPEAEDDFSDFPDNELGAVVAFDEDDLDEAQTEADVKNITSKHQMTIEELKREVLGSVRNIFLNYEQSALVSKKKTVKEKIDVNAPSGTVGVRHMSSCPFYKGSCD